MEIKDLQPRQGNINLVVEVINKGEERSFQKFGRTGRVATATVKDDSGEIKLTLWNDEIDKVSVGDKLELKNCYVNEFQGEKQITTGRFGTIDVVEKAAQPEQEKSTEAEEPEEELIAEEEEIKEEE